MFLKERAGAGTYPIQFFQGLSFLHLMISFLHVEITLLFALQNCVMHLKKNYFLLPP